jgi:hypothetical protein
MGMWMYSSTILNLGTGWKWVVSFDIKRVEIISYTVQLILYALCSLSHPNSSSSSPSHFCFCSEICGMFLWLNWILVLTIASTETWTSIKHEWGYQKWYSDPISSVNGVWKDNDIRGVDRSSFVILGFVAYLFLWQQITHLESYVLRYETFVFIRVVKRSSLACFAGGIRDRDLARREFVIFRPVLHTASTGEVPFSATFSASETNPWTDL